MAYDFKNAKILIIDDMKPMVSLTKSVLNIYGFKDVFTAENGEEGFEVACKEDPDLIIVDWMMDPMDGLEFTRLIRRNPMAPNPYVPILMMTGFSSRLRVEEARDSGVTEFLVKPFSSMDLYKRVAQIVEKPRQFIDAETFFGPDRRRKIDDGYQGTRRRNDDSRKESAGKAGQNNKANEILQQLRDQAKGISE